MFTRRGQLVYILILLAALVGLNYALTGSFAPPTGDAAIWYHGGLLMLILGMYFIEPYFTKPSDVVINGLVVFISISTLSNPPNEWWWDSLRYFSLFCAVVAFFVVWLGSPAVAGYDTSFAKRMAYLLVVRLGNSAVLFSAVFLLALLSYFDPVSPVPRWMLAFWILLLVLRQLDLEGLAKSLFAAYRSRRAKAVGRLSRFAQPNIARFEILSGQDCPRGTLVAFTANGLADATSVLAIVVAHRSAPRTVEAEALLVDSHLARGRLRAGKS